jgi:hypothetical protein
MGLRNRLKIRKSDENDLEDVGGLNLADTSLETNWKESLDSEEDVDLPQDELDVSPAQQGFQEPAALAQEEGEKKEEGGEKGKEQGDGGELSGLDIFTSEMAIEGDKNKLADQLPQVDVQDLLRECQEIASRLREGISGDR